MFVSRYLLSCALAILLSQALIAEPATCVPMSMGEKWEKRFIALRDRNKEKSPDILIFGEALFEKWNFRPEFSPIFKEMFGHRKFVNFCSGGEHPQTLLWKLSNGNALQGLNPKLIVLNIGGDNNRDSAPNTLEAIKKLISVIKLQSAGAKLLLIPPMRRGKEGGDYWRRSEEVARGTQELADGKMIFFLDLEINLADKGGKRRPELFEKNSFSFNKAGYKEAGNLLKGTFCDILGN